MVLPGNDEKSNDACRNNDGGGGGGGAEEKVVTTTTTTTLTPTKRENTNKKNAFEILMSNRTVLQQQPKMKKLKSSSSASSPTKDAFEKMLWAAEQPKAFKPVSPEEILAYIDRHPSWYYLFEELIRLEKKEQNDEVPEQQQQQPKKKNNRRTDWCEEEVEEERCCSACGSKGDGWSRRPTKCADSMSKLTENIIEENVQLITDSLDSPPSGVPGDYYDYYESTEENPNKETCWCLTDELRKRLDLQAKLNDNQTNELLPPPPPAPSRPNKGAALITIKFHFREDYYEEFIPDPHDDGFGDEGYPRGESYQRTRYVICGWTLVYNDHRHIDCVDLDDHLNPICNRTAIINLATEEHIVAIDPYDKFFLKRPGLEFCKTKLALYTNQNRWLVVDNGDQVETRKYGPQFKCPHEGQLDRSIQAPKGEVFQFFEPKRAATHNKRDIVKLVNVVFCPIQSLKVSKSHTTNYGDDVNNKLQQTNSLNNNQYYYQRKAMESHKKAYDDLKTFEKDAYETCTTMARSFGDKLNKSSEATVVRSLNQLMDYAITNLKRKQTLLVDHMKKAYAPTYQAASRKYKMVKAAALEEQVKIFHDHQSFLQTNNALLSGGDRDDKDSEKESSSGGGVLGSTKRLCFYCRKVYTPRLLSTLRRCKVKGCRSAFEMCGCQITVCEDECKGIFCPDHHGSYHPTCEHRTEDELRCY